jgi:hypothetical protein
MPLPEAGRIVDVLGVVSSATGCGRLALFGARVDRAVELVGRKLARDVLP